MDLRRLGDGDIVWQFVVHGLNASRYFDAVNSRRARGRVAIT
jgi:hypothetical protein